eukprot:2175754-Pyramimonas_sp.AAC.1
MLKPGQRGLLAGRRGQLWAERCSQGYPWGTFFGGPLGSSVGAVRGYPGAFLEPVEGFNEAQRAPKGAHKAAPNGITPRAFGTYDIHGGLFCPFRSLFWAPPRNSAGGV